MFIEDKIKELLGNYTDEDVMTGKKVTLEIDYNDLIKIDMALDSKEAIDDLLIKAYAENESK